MRSPLGAGALVLVVVVAIGIFVGRSGSSTSAGGLVATGTSGPSDRDHESHHHQPRRHHEHRYGRWRRLRNEPKVAVPKVVGETVALARSKLASLGLRGKFTWSDGPALNCSNALPSARVLSQWPEAGEMIRPNHAVGLSASAYAQTGCGRPSTSRPCEPSELALRILEGMPEFTGGSEYELVTVKVVHAWGRRPCSVDSMLSLAVDQPQGELASRLRGNPAQLELHADLDRGEKMEAGWTLGSWCGSRRGVVAVATLEGVTANRFLRKLPYGQGDCPLLEMYSLYKG